MPLRLTVVIVLVLGSLQSLAQSPADVLSSDAYVRLPVPGQKNAAAFMTLRNRAEKDRVLTSVSCSCAAKAELHSHRNEGGVMKMRREASVKLPAAGSFEFAPGGWHIMLLDFNRALRTGDAVDITLSFANGDTLQVPAVTKSVFDSSDHQHHH
ncbi:copper chaperone PCu(A)C [Gilvimarinus algae]|uniref:Copper chaperone PCu(A)C n=1 Tax=Gilvimarinus algae TaxID=3058037 RepID=A0ABT8TFM4_9GAMM|nr:copper chaperone PCu(A)C [Gilvimarinus sp. SDUM040014]MDO3382895.1 copper chaperone PCu(A)C [Gilvimarinus sp. SDUM040014]